ncbi:MAG TPA: N-acetyltransferase [Candidatus Dormibacteraeota bacterium]|jgi:ribosomal protein S18 acetylase RimI-like enzyme
MNAERLIELARAQLGEPADWSLATDAPWLQRMYASPGVIARVWELPTGELSGSAAVRTELRSLPPDPPAVIVNSMLSTGCEGLWDEQRAWIQAALDEAGISRIPEAHVQVVSEALCDAEVARWASSGFEVVFEELAMEFDLMVDGRSLLPRWPRGTRVLDWGTDAAAASFIVYDAAFRDRPGFPGWTRSEWTDRLTGGDDFLPAASLCVLVDAVPAGFVVCSQGWIDQAGVAPAYRRVGLASALVTEAAARMRAGGVTVARLHVNTNNPAALATWRSLGWKVVGRRGRFERRSAPR